MPPATLPKSNTPISALSSVTTNTTTMAVQSGPYTKTQFQSTMEGSRTIKSSKEVEQLLRDYPAALELYRTGKYKVKVKCEADVERVILVEKRSPKAPANKETTATTSDTSTKNTTTNEASENNQTVPDLSSSREQSKETRKDRSPRRSRSRTHSQDRVAPIKSITNGGNIVHTTISSIRMTSNTQPKVDHQRTHSKEREASVTPQQKQFVHGRSHSRDSQHKTSYNKQQQQQQGNKINREYPKMLVPFVGNTNNPGNLWQQQRPQQPYFSNPLLQQQRSALYMASPFIQQQNPLYRQPFYYGQQPSAPHGVFQQDQRPPYPALTISTVGKAPLHPNNNYSSSSRSVSNTMGLPPSFRTFHSNQQPPQQQHPSLRHIYQTQAPVVSFNPQWANIANQPIGALTNTTNNNNMYVNQKRGARDRARSVDTGGHRNLPVRLSNFQQQQPPVPVMENKYHYHHHRHRSHTTHNADTTVTNNKEQAVVAKEPSHVGNGEKLTVRQLNETFIQTNPSGRLPYSSIPAVLQRFGITLTENDVTSAAKELGYNLNETISARRLVHILVKLGKITKSNQQQHQQQQQPQRQPVSPSMLPEDREVTDIMTQHKAATTHNNSSDQPNQWN
ncbi:unnamed protein product [Adineta steineri]|uniref:Uncharacterized protein n=1 Tax=Adineta steineri TaxID=433720 RepID=A0A815MCZ4_9BILA|nr:unnamed protein product [Adineta steineri]CAF1167504.1 unnamed protein product [Adineta steineri]CAF1422858.1 unnamed protein product [Adineta steineri]